MSRSVSKAEIIILIIFMGLCGLALLAGSIWLTIKHGPSFGWERVEAVQEDHDVYISGSYGGRGGTNSYTVKCDVKLDYTYRGVPYTTTVKHSPTGKSGQNTTATWYVNPDDPTQASDVRGNLGAIILGYIFALICLIPALLMIKEMREQK